MRARRETRGCTGWAVRAAKRDAPGARMDVGFGARLASFPSELRGLLPARLEGGAVTVRTRRGGERTLELRPLSSGGSNTVYTIPELPGCVLRVSSGALSPNDRRAYYREIAVQRKLAAMGLSPRVVAVVYTPTRVGVIMERFDATLEDVLCNEEDTRRVFVEHDGEGALIELMMLVSRVSSCVDTKAANVVVRLEPTVALALIDVDVYFCGVKQRPRPSDAPGVEWLRAELRRATSAPRAKPPLGALVAMSLLILCLDSAPVATMGQLRRIAAALLEHAPTVMRLVADDEIATVAPGNKAAYAWMGAGESVFRQLAHYTPIKRLAEIETRLALAARETRGARLLRICSAPPDAALLVAAMRAPPRASKLLDRARTQDEIRRVVHATP